VKRRTISTLSVIILVSMVFFIPSNATAYGAFNPIVTGDEIHWTVLNCNDTHSYTWTDVSYIPKGKYVLSIGENIKFTVNDPATCTGNIEIGNLTMNSVTRDELGLNLMLITGPAFPPFSNYSFNPALISPTNWATQIELANNATNERIGASLNVETYNMTFLGTSRAIISFYFTYFGQVSKAIYDNDTGLLLYMYSKYQFGYLELKITNSLDSDNIPSFEIILSISLLSLIIIVIYCKRRAQITSHYTSTN